MFHAKIKAATLLLWGVAAVGLSTSGLLHSTSTKPLSVQV
jgi:hypothetical protein